MAKTPSKTDPAEEARLRTILDSMVEAVFVTDPKGRVTLTNEALDELMVDDVRGKRAKNVIKNKALRLAIRRARKKDEAAEVSIETEIGSQLHTFQAQVAPLPGGAGVVTVLHDVTRLKQADRVRRDFVANASHELRTPLTAIRGFAETLRDGALEDPDASRRFLDAILRHTARLQRLAEDMTVLSQAESLQHGFEERESDLRSVCEMSASTLESYARKKRIELAVELPDVAVTGQIAARALEHVLINLLENAIKYSEHESRVVLRLTDEGEAAVIEVQDWGAGIPEKYQARIFERFYRVDKGRSRDEGGTGLGLAIVRNMVERMDGTISVSSTLGEGSTFRVVVPLGSDEDE